MEHSNKLYTSLLTAVVASFIVGCSGAYSSSNARESGASEPTTLADAKGMVYYTFDKDSKNSGRSACYRGCATQWPPVPASASSGKAFGKIERKDGRQQLTFNGQPLYYFIGDIAPGDRNGDGMGGTWHLATSTKAKKSKTTDSYERYGDSYGY